MPPKSVLLRLPDLGRPDLPNARIAPPCAVELRYSVPSRNRRPAQRAPSRRQIRAPVATCAPELSRVATCAPAPSCAAPSTCHTAILPHYLDFCDPTNSSRSQRPAS